MLAFNNDYSRGAHPAALQALVDTNMEPQPGDGTDAHTERAKHLIREACRGPRRLTRFFWWAARRPTRR